MGIGLGIARILVHEGARVALFDSDERLIDAVREVQGSAAFKVD